MIVLAILVGALTAGCTTLTAGMQSPLAHDYERLRWQNLESQVSQQIIVAPGYTALIENDPGTEPPDLLARIDQMPDDVRGSELREIRLAVRPVEDRAFAPELSVAVWAIDGASEPVISTLADLDVDGDWIIFTRFPPVAAGQTLVVRIDPVPGWEFATTPGRIPYGGYVATTGSNGETEEPLAGALGFQTIFEQRTAVDELAWTAFGDALPSVLTDPVLLGIYAIILGAGGGIWVSQRRRVEGV